MNVRIDCGVTCPPSPVIGEEGGIHLERVAAYDRTRTVSRVELSRTNRKAMHPVDGIDLRSPAQMYACK